MEEVETTRIPGLLILKEEEQARARSFAVWSNKREKQFEVLRETRQNEELMEREVWRDQVI